MKAFQNQTERKDKPPVPHRDRIGRAVAVAVMLLAAAGVFFGLHPHYRFVAAALLGVAVVAVLRPRWWWWLTDGVLLGAVALLWMFGPSGYRYASLVPLAAAVLVTVCRFGSRALRTVVCVLVALGTLGLAVVEVPIVSAARDAAEAEADYVIVLGAAVYGETPSVSLKNRVERAIAYLEAHPSAKAVVSGGRGEGEDITEAECMRRYMEARGVAPDRILTEEHSTSTMENLAFSKAIIEADGGGSAAIVSSSYHLYRAKAMASSLGMEAAGLASSDGYPVYMFGMFVREALGVVKLWTFGSWEREACLASAYAR